MTERKQMYDFRMALSIVCGKIGIIMFGLAPLGLVSHVLHWMKTGELDDYARLGK